MVAGLQRLMVGPQQGAAALRDKASRHRRTLTSAATLGTAAALAVAARHRRRRPASPSSAQPKRQVAWFLHPLAVHAISGAAGEVCQVATTYPLSTIAVKCQAHGTSTRAVLAELRGLGSKRAGVASLYRGLGASAIVAAMVGAVYLSSFHFFSEQLAVLSDRFALAGQRQRAHSSASFGGSSSGSGTSAIPVAASLAAAPQMCAGQPMQALAPAAATAALWHSSRSATAASTGQQRRRRHWRQSEPRDDLVSAAAAVAGTDTDLSADSNAHSPSSHFSGQYRQGAVHSGSSDNRVGDGSHVAAEMAAAMLASVGTAFFEGPLEIFQHRAQAGMCGGLGVGRGMMAAFSAGGFRSVFGGYTAFMIKTVPQDVAELLTFSRLAAAREAATPDNMSKFSPLRSLQQLPDEAADMLMGATAGAASVLISMPLECIKTVIDTGGGPNPKPAQGLATFPQFWRTGRSIAAANGFGALFRGLAPNMVETVPSAMVYWLAVESCRRALAPYTAGQPSSSAS